MGMLEIILLIAGALIFVLSFIIPVKKEELNTEAKKLAESEIKQLVSQEVEQVRNKLGEMSDEACQEQLEKAKRSMERISNEKIMAVNEYSDTVLSEIHKNHQEVVFLYDMLNDKQSGLKDTISQADKDIKDLLQQVKDSEITVREKLDKQQEVMTQATVGVQPETVVQTTMNMQQEAFVPSMEVLTETTESEDERPSFTPFVPEKVSVTPKRVRKATPKKAVKAKEVPTTEPSAEEKKEELLLDQLTDTKTASDVQLQFSSQRDNGANSNERILELHKAGKSNMAIAKELGLGIGEVKLVIDLYEGLR